MKCVIGSMTLRSVFGLWALTGAACGATDAAQATQAGRLASKGPVVGPTSAGGVAAWGAPAGNEYLATLRGGFDAGSGLSASFGIDRAVYVNGNLVTSSTLYIPDVGQMSAAQASALATMVGTSNVVQTGRGDRLDPSAFAQVTPATLVQNTWNNQRIQTLTTINATVNTLDHFKSLNLQNTLQSALINSLGH